MVNLLPQGGPLAARVDPTRVARCDGLRERPRQRGTLAASIALSSSCSSAAAVLGPAGREGDL